MRLHSKILFQSDLSTLFCKCIKFETMHDWVLYIMKTAAYSHLLHLSNEKRENYTRTKKKQNYYQK